MLTISTHDHVDGLRGKIDQAKKMQLQEQDIL